MSIIIVIKYLNTPLYKMQDGSDRPTFCGKNPYLRNDYRYLNRIWYTDKRHHSGPYQMRTSTCDEIQHGGGRYLVLFKAVSTSA